MDARTRRSIPTCVGLTEADLQIYETLSPRYQRRGQLHHTRHSRPFSRNLIRARTQLITAAWRQLVAPGG